MTTPDKDLSHGLVDGHLNGVGPGVELSHSGGKAQTIGAGHVSLQKVQILMFDDFFKWAASGLFFHLFLSLSGVE